MGNVTGWFAEAVPVSPGPVLLTLTGSTPTVTVSGNQTATPAPLLLRLTGGYQPFSPARVSLTLTGGTPVVSTGNPIQPTPISLTLTGGTPVVTSPSAGANYTDLFNRSNSSTLGASWTTNGSNASLEISSNAAQTTTFGSASNIYTSAMVTGNNQVTVVMKGTPTSGFASITLREDSATSTSSATKFVQLSMAQSSQWTLYRYAADGGVQTVGNVSWVDGDTVVFTAVGGTLTVKLNGSTVHTTTGATDLAAGYVVLSAFASPGDNFGFDSFNAQDI